MSTTPAPPRNERGELAIGRYQLLDSLHSGLLGSCCACGHTCGTWWHDGARGYVALHERCTGRLIEMWQAMIEDGIGEAPVSGKLTGAYARRAAARAQASGVSGATAPSPLAPRSIDRGSPFFRPGMADGSPWAAWAQTSVDRPLVPCGGNEQAARAVVARWRAANALGVHDPGRALVLGAVVVGPDGAISDGWGRHPVPGDTPPWPGLTQSATWFSCPECHERRWPGCWRLLGGTCVGCLRGAEDAGRPGWPSDPVVHEPDPLTVVKKLKREKASSS
jgi:hypothetical protein